VSQQSSTKTPPVPVQTDPLVALKNTRRTLLQLVANIDAAIAAHNRQEERRPER
jgi:hypothetical protein